MRAVVIVTGACMAAEGPLYLVDCRGVRGGSTAEIQLAGCTQSSTGQIGFLTRRG